MYNNYSFSVFFRSCFSCFSLKTIWRCVIVTTCVFVSGVSVAESNSKPQDWVRQPTSYTYSSYEPQLNYVPPKDAPSRTVYDAFSFVARKDFAGLSLLLLPNAQPDADAFFKRWSPRIDSWQIEFMQTGVLEDQGWAYVVVGSDRPLPSESHKGIFVPFTSVLFLEHIENRWTITHRNLDPVERETVIRDFTVLRQGVPKAEVEAQLEQSRRMWFEKTGRPLGVAAEDWDADAAYAKHKKTEAYLNTRRKEGSLATSFSEMMEMYGGEYVSPPVTFSITQEPENPNLDNLLDAFQTAIYIRLLRHNHYPRKWGWKAREPSDVNISGLSAEILPVFSYVTGITLAKLTRVQIMCRIPLQYKGNKYQKIHYRIVDSDDEATMRINDYRPPYRFIAFGYAYFKKEGTRWLPNKDLDGYAGFSTVYGSSKGIDESILFLVPNQAKSRRLSDVKKYFQDSPMPEHMRRLYSTEECIEIEDARKSGMWKGL